MRIFLLSILLLASLASLAASKQVYMSYVFRHGARYPLNNLYDGKQTAPFHGQLTSVGLREQYLLGSYIQSDYANKLPFINTTLKPREVDFSTVFDSQRCIQSAYGHALGLFSFGNGQKIDPSIDPKLLEPPFQTLSSSLRVQDAPSSTDFALFNGFQPVPIRNGQHFFPKCDNQVKIFERRAEKCAPQVAQLQAEHTLFVAEMKRLFDLPAQFTNVGGLAALYDTLVADAYLGRPLPTKLTDKDFDKLYFIQRYLFALVNEGQPARIFNAPFVNSLIANMQLAVQGKLGAKKLSILSAHDSNVVPLMVYFNLTSSDCLKRQWKNETVHENCAVPIPFASNLIFQLHQNDQSPSNYFVKVRFNGEYYKLCGKNSTECAFEEFAQKAKNHLMDFEKECAKPKQKDFIDKINLIDE